MTPVRLGALIVSGIALLLLAFIVPTLVEWQLLVVTMR